MTAWADVAQARVENDAMDKKQVARAQKVLDSDSGGPGTSVKISKSELRLPRLR